MAGLPPHTIMMLVTRDPDGTWVLDDDGASGTDRDDFLRWNEVFGTLDVAPVSLPVHDSKRSAPPVTVPVYTYDDGGGYVSMETLKEAPWNK
jgi:hypothetical protein